MVTKGKDHRGLNMKIYYFAYGSNMDPCRMIKRSLCSSRREHAILEGWKLVFNKVSRRNQNEDFANIEREEGSIVEGILYEIECSDLEKLDRHEGYPEHY